MLRNIRGLHIEGRKQMSTEAPIQTYLKPEYVYVPLSCGPVPYKAIVAVGDKVLKGQAVALREDRFGHPIHSSVSGVVSAIKKMWHPFARMVETIEIKNDFQEIAIADFGQPLKELTKENIINRVKNAGIVGLGGAGFPTYIKYMSNRDAKVVIINAAECEPYLTADAMLIQTAVDKLIRGIKYIMIASGAPKAVIAIKKTKRTLIAHLESSLVNNPQISVFLLNDVYPAGWEKYIVERVLKKSYHSLPIEVGAVINNVATVIAVCEAIEENKPLIEKVITITGEGIKQPQNFFVKIGVKASDLISLAGGYVDDLEDAYFIAGGPMSGKAIFLDDMIITPYLTSVIVKPKGFVGLAQPCMGCGKCAEYCPAYLTPTEIKKAFLAGDLEEAEKQGALKCVQCGLCSYVCPSRVEITDSVVKAQEAVKKANSAKVKKG